MPQPAPMRRWGREQTETTSRPIDDRGPAATRRIALGTGASGARVLLFTFFQLISVPLFLHRWSNELYGSWLIFYTIPSYLSFADLGLQSAVGSSMSIHVANNHYREAAQELWAYARVLTLVLVIVGSGALAAVDVFPLSRALHIGAMTPAASMVVGTSLVLYGALAVLSGISSAGYRAVGLFARQLVFVTLASLLDYVVLMGLLLIDGRPAVLALGLLAIRAVSTLLLFVDFRRVTPWFRLRTRVDVNCLRRLVGPSLGYLGFPVGNIVQNQGMLMVAALVAPGQVVLLNFWATYCIPCREEIPALNSLQHDLEAQGLKVVGASLDDDVAGVNAYQKEVRKFEYEVLLGGSDAKTKFAQTVLPTTYLIDRMGRIRQKIIGARDRATWEAAVKPLLAEAPATASAGK